MIFNNPNFVTFAGEPITGRTPTKTVVLGDWPMTQAQQGGVAHAYKLFCDTVRLSPAGYHVQNRVLQDGSRVRMIPNNGLDTVTVWPAGGGRPTVEYFFRGVPSSSTNKRGVEDLGPSGRWTNYLTMPMPAKLRKAGALADHPGHVTWAGEGFKVNGQEAILSWRGPGDRYATSTGWSTPEGGVILSHAVTAAQVGDMTYLYRDSSFVWFDGRAVNTGIEKIIAAALHRPDPAKLDEVVLRVCSDSFPQLTGTRKLVVFDLVPTGKDAPTGLVNILNATGFVILATYPAAQFSTATNLPTTGTWINHQRPHFNDKGDKLATSISWRDVPIAENPPRFVAACFSPTSWEMLDYFGPAGVITTDQTASTTFTWVPSAEPPLVDTVETAYANTQTMQHSVLLAADFLGTAFVHVVLARTATQVITVNSSGTLSDCSETRLISNTSNIQVVHSVHGVLATKALSDSSNATTAYQSGLYSIVKSGPGLYSNWIVTNLCGDVSRDVLAVGYSVAAQQSISGSGGYADSSLVYATDVAATGTRETVAYDVFVMGAAVAVGTVGSYAAGPNPVLPFTASVSSPKPTVQTLADSQQPVPSYSSSTTVGFSDMVNWNGVIPLFRHSAVSGEARAGYLGVALSTELGGLELAFAERRVNGTTSYELLTVPAYAPGPTPTICAPIFLGVRKV